MQILKIKLNEIEARAKEILSNCEKHFEFFTGYIDFKRDSLEDFLVKVCKDLKAKEERIIDLEDKFREIEKILNEVL